MDLIEPVYTAAQLRPSEVTMSKVTRKDITLLISRIYSGSLLGPAYGPTKEAPRLLARREHSRIGLYYHAP